MSEKYKNSWSSIKLNALKYALKEALKQAEIKGRELAIAKANAPSFRQKVSRFAEGMSQVTTARTSSPPVRRVRRRKVVRVRTPVRRRKIKKRVIRIVKRKHKRTSTRKPVIKRINPLAPTQNWRF